jgi:sec-independent protein translocase protein TatB
MPFDLSVTKLLLLGLIAMLVFGPDKLPQVARDAARMLRQLRGFAQQARSDLKSELGDTVGDFDIADLNPRTFVRKHLFEDETDVSTPPAVAAPAVAAAPAAAPTLPAARTGPVPFDPDAT